MSAPAVRPTTAAEQPRLAAVLAEAFADDDPLAHALPRDVPRRDARLRRFFALELARSRRLGGAWTGADGEGAAVWYPPGHWRPSTWEALLATPGSLRVFGRHSARAARILAYLLEHHPREPHWYLAYLGTRRERQSTGVGGALLAAVVERCDKEGLPAYLEASTERNRALYLRHGFTDAGPLELPDGGPTLFAMWRAPR